MLQISRKVLSLEPQEIMELERIITDDDRDEALRFLKRSVYKRLLTSQEDRLKSHLDGDHDPAGSFRKKNE
jgi:hypothetical protein